MGQKNKIGVAPTSRGINRKKPRKGIHSKNNTSKNKNSKNYTKPYRCQGR